MSLVVAEHSELTDGVNEAMANLEVEYALDVADVDDNEQGDHVPYEGSSGEEDDIDENIGDVATEVEYPTLDKSLMPLLATRRLPKRRGLNTNRYETDGEPNVGVFANFMKHQIGAELFAIKERGKLKSPSARVYTSLKPFVLEKVDGTICAKDSRISFIVRRPNSWNTKVRGEFGKALLSLVGHLMKFTFNESMNYLYVGTIKTRRDQMVWELFGELACMNPLVPLENKKNVELVDVSYVKPLFEKYESACELELSWEDWKEDSQFIMALADPQDYMLPAVDRMTLPEYSELDRYQKAAIARVGNDAIIVLHGPPGAGKSLTIYNAVRYRRRLCEDGRIDFSEKVIVTCCTNRAVGSIVEKFKESYAQLPIEAEYDTWYPDTMIPFAVCGNQDSLKKKVGDWIIEFHVDSITRRIVKSLPNITPWVEKFADLKAAFVDKETFLANASGLHFDLMGEDKTDEWRTCVAKHLVGEKPAWQAFVDDFINYESNSKESRVVSFVDDSSHFQIKKSNIRKFSEFKYFMLLKFELSLEIRYSKHFNSTRDYVVERSQVIMCTIDTLPSKLLKDLRADMVIIDEAGQVPEEAMGHIARLRPSGSVVFVGDHKQLLPATEDKSAEKTSATMSKYLRSTLERFVNVHEQDSEKICEIDTLEINYRNPGVIVKCMNDMTYGGMLKSAPRVEPPNALMWIDHNEPETSKTVRQTESEVSHYNQGEAVRVYDVYKAERAKNPGKSVMVITFYARQMAVLKDLFRGEHKNDVCTVDSSQGSEFDIVIVSTVRSNDYGGIGFADRPNRLNVTISRAKDKLIFVGNKATFGFTRDNAPKNPLWHHLIGYIANIEDK